MFSKEFTWFGNLKRKAKSILLPYLLINSFWIIFFKMMQSFEITSSYFAGETYQIVGIKGVFEAYLGQMPLYYPFWFLKDLMILNLFASIIKLAINRLPVLSAISIIALQLQFISLPFLVSNNSFCMFALGCYLVKYKIDVKKLDKIKMQYSGLLFAGVIWVKLYLLKDQVLLSTIYIFCGICFYYQMTGKIKESKNAENILWCSQFTFFIYAFHEYYEAMIKKILMMIIPQYGIVQLLEFFLLPIVIVACCIIAGAILKKQVPLLYGLICGQR